MLFRFRIVSVGLLAGFFQLSSGVEVLPERT